MGLFDFLKKHHVEEPPPLPDLSPYSGMRVEVSGKNGHLLFLARIANPREDKLDLYQFSSSDLTRSQEDEPLPVRIRGYFAEEQKAVTMEGTISAAPQASNLWLAENIVVVSVENSRAFFRLETRLEAVIIPLDEGKEEKCRLLNISVGGVRIQTDTPYLAGDQFRLRVQLLADRDPSVILCEVMRVIKKENAPLEYGCRFLDLKEADEDRITENIFAAQRKRRGGRL